jgi:hypothetical protein
MTTVATRRATRRNPKGTKGENTMKIHAIQTGTVAAALEVAA